MNPVLIATVLKRTLLLATYLLWAILLASFFINYNFQPIGVRFGGYALVTLWLVMLPGILKRFQPKGLLQTLQIILMSARRRLGIFMFTLALTHFTWNRLFDYLQQGFPKPQTIPGFERAGFTALVLLLPLFLTSNDQAVSLLKKNWQRLHYLIYPAIWLIALHVTLMGGRLFKFALPTLILASIQIASRIYPKLKNLQNSKTQVN